MLSVTFRYHVECNVCPERDRGSIWDYPLLGVHCRQCCTWEVMVHQMRIAFSFSTWNSSTRNTYWYSPRSHYLPESNLPVSTCVLCKIKGDRLAWICWQLLLVTRHTRFPALNLSMTFSSINYYLQFKWKYSGTSFVSQHIFWEFLVEKGYDLSIVGHEIQSDRV